VQSTGSGFNLEILGTPGIKYHLEQSTNLENWSIVGTLALDAEGKDSIPQFWDGNTSLFYRLRPR
ncbi:MAG: hypothetical protein KJT03_24330, partial [Verrucomicrobiae bacterium]|nr:hypothetical protein [Verrucomicrobiae bacterium]